MSVSESYTNCQTQFLLILMLWNMEAIQNPYFLGKLKEVNKNVSEELKINIFEEYVEYDMLKIPGLFWPTSVNRKSMRKVRHSTSWMQDKHLQNPETCSLPHWCSQFIVKLFTVITEPCVLDILCFRPAGNGISVISFFSLYKKLYIWYKLWRAMRP